MHVIFAKIFAFSQKSVRFRKNLRIFAKIGKFSRKSANFRKNRYVFAKICEFSQKSVNFHKNANCRKNPQKNCKFSQNSEVFAQKFQIFAKNANFRKTLYIFAKIGKFSQKSVPKRRQTAAETQRNSSSGLRKTRRRQRHKWTAKGKPVQH